MAYRDDLPAALACTAPTAPRRAASPKAPGGLRVALVAAAAVVGCGQSGNDNPFCAGTTSVIFDPASRQVAAWPDDFWTVDDAASATGVRLHVVAGGNVDLPQGGAMFQKVFGDLSLLDGFGTTAPLFVRFTGPLDVKTLPASGDGSGRAESAVLLVDLDSPSPRAIDCEFSVTDEFADSTNPADRAATLVISPMVPLEAKHHYGLAITSRLHDAAGGCIAPSPVMRQLLSGTATDPALVRLQKRLGDFTRKLQMIHAIAAPAELSAAFVFTTQHTVDDSAAIAADIRKHKVAYVAKGPCALDRTGMFRTCEGTMAAFDYRANHLYVDEASLTAHDPYQVPVVIYLPVMPAQGGYPTIVFGHGLGGDRTQAAELAVLAAPRGFATVAIDAVKHGDHPDRPATAGKLQTILDFFGFSLSGGMLDTRKLRDNFRQSTYDKLQLVELLRPGIDADGDGMADVGLDRLVYLGVSLGGIMAAEFLALVPEVKVALPIVPGARVTEIIQFAKTFAPVINLFKGSASDGDIVRFFPTLQTAVDRGDAGAYTRQVMTARLPGFDAARPQLLMQMVIADDTVPNVSNLFFARGLGVPHVGDELLKIGSIAHAQALPVKANLDATHTGGVFQYDIVWAGGGPMTQMATHGNVAANGITITQTLHFVETALQGQPGSAEIIDPYRTLGVKR